MALKLAEIEGYDLKPLPALLRAAEVGAMAARDLGEDETFEAPEG